MSLKSETLPSFQWYDRLWTLLKMEILFIFGRRRHAKLLKAQCDFLDCLDIYDRNISIAYQKRQDVINKRNQIKFRLQKAREKCLEFCHDNLRGNLTSEQHVIVNQWEHLRKMYQMLSTRYNAIQTMYLQINQMKSILQETYMNAEMTDDMYEITQDLKTAKISNIETVIRDCNEKLLKNAQDLTNISEKIEEFENSVDLEGFTETVGARKNRTIKTVSDLRMLLMAPDDQPNISLASLNFDA